MKITVTHPTIEEVFKDFYAIPAFQREYVWKDAQVDALLEDAFDALFDENGSPVDTEYFIGSIVAYKEGDVFQLIDGQQRITTLYLALCAIRDALSMAAPNSDCSHLNNLIRATYQDDLGQTQSQFRLIPLYEDAGQELQNIAEFGVIDSSDIKNIPSSAKNMRNTYRTVRSFISERLSDTPQKIILFQARLSKRIRLVRIETASVSDALRIFETINDRGVGLNAMDLLKNLLFMNTKKDLYDSLTQDWQKTIRTIEEAKEKPLRFLRYFILSRYIDARKNAKPLTEDDLYEWLDKHKSQLGISTNPTGFAKELLRAAEDYRAFVIKPSRHLKHINRLSGRARQHLMVMLAGRSLAPLQLEKLSSKLESLFLAFLLIKEPTKALDIIFSNAAPKLREIGKDATDIQLENFLNMHIEPEINKRADRITDALTTMSLERKTITRFLLARLSQYSDEMASKIPKDIDDYWACEIEHILPNTPTQAILSEFDKPNDYDRLKQRLGNLVLLEKSINAAIGQNYFETKKIEYVKSNLLMTRALGAKQSVGVNTSFTKIAEYFPEYSFGNSDAIFSRQNDLIKLAHEVWNFPLAIANG